MALMAHQISLILLFLWPQSLDLVDPSCILERNNVSGHLLSKFGTNPSIGKGGIMIMADFRKLQIENSIKVHNHCPK